LKLIPDTEIDWNYYESVPEDACNVKPASNWCESVINRIHSPQASSGWRLPWEKTNSLMRFRPGEVTIWGGINGHRKSLTLGQVVLGFNHQGGKACIASLEMPPEATMHRMTLQATGLPEPTPDYIKTFHQWTDNKLWIYDQRGFVKHTRIVALTRYCFEHLGIDHMIIDSLMKCGINTDDHNTQKKFINSLCDLAKDYGKHVHLVAHVRKGSSEYDKPDKFDLKGAGDIIDQTDNLIIVWANKRKEKDSHKNNPDENIQKESDLLLMVKKQRNGEWEGDFHLWFNNENLQHVSGSNSRVMNMCGIGNESFNLA